MKNTTCRESGNRSATNDDAVRQTNACFGFKWAKRDTYDSEEVRKTIQRWLIERYLDGDAGLLDDWLTGSGKVILDVGCGAGFSAQLLFGERLNAHHYLGLDYSKAVAVAKERYLEAQIRGNFVRGDIMHAPFKPEIADIVFSEGVFHHTGDTRAALLAATRLLRPGGLMLFYVYAKKAVVREFTDDNIRATLHSMTDDEAWQALRPLTLLGKTLGELHVEIEVPEDIGILGIKAGRMDLQRFFYWNFLKLFYDPAWSLEEMLHINFDWFRPLHCQRQSPEEVDCWCREARLDIQRMNVQESGITVVAIKSNKTCK